MQAAINHRVQVARPPQRDYDAVLEWAMDRGYCSYQMLDEFEARVDALTMVEGVKLEVAEGRALADMQELYDE